MKRPESSPKVSVIVPVFNEAKTVAVAVESVALQRTEFDVEILVIDDCSTDETPEILEDIVRAYPNVTVLRNESNSGKGFSFKRAYELAKGQYFHVLDGDDCFVCYDKLQRQVEFLESNLEYFAVGHNTLINTPDGAFLMHDQLREQSWSNDLCVAGKVYCHTSSLLFRKIAKKLPDYFLDEEFRGDTAIFFFTAFHSKLKCKFFPNVWSIYNFHGKGLWSSLQREEQREFNLRIVQALRDKVVQAPGSQADQLLDERKERVLAAPPIDRSTSPSSLEDLLLLAEQASFKVLKHRDQAFQGMHAYRFVDEICEAAGRTICLKAGTTAMNRDIDPKHAILLVSGLVPGGGGVFNEIKDLTKILLRDGYRVGLISTHKIPTSEAILDRHFSGENMWYWQAPPDASRTDRLESILALLIQEAPGIIFPIITHDDPVGDAAIQRPLGARVVFDFVYDHGLSLGVLNSSIDTILVKTVSQARALAPMIPRANFSLVPPFIEDRFGPRDYTPMANGSLTTASAAARAYKVSDEYVYSYSKIIPRLLKASGGTHIHYGPLSESTKELIKASLRKLRISEDCFRHIPWADDFGGSLISENVDLFISPFPICSARIAVEVMACAIPSVSHVMEAPGIPQGIDFVDPQQFVWRRPSDLIRLVSTLDAEELLEKSTSARVFFEANNELEEVSEKFFAFDRLEMPRFYNQEFLMSDVSCKLDGNLSSPVFRSGKAKFPKKDPWLDFPSAVSVESFGRKTFWHRTRARRFMRRQFRLLRTVARDLTDSIGARH